MDKNLTKEQLTILEGYYELSELEDEIHKDYSFEEYLDYCNSTPCDIDKDKTILEYLLEE